MAELDALAAVGQAFDCTSGRKTGRRRRGQTYNRTPLVREPPRILIGERGGSRTASRIDAYLDAPMREAVQIRREYGAISALRP